MKSLVYTIFMLVIVSITGCTGRSTVKALDRAESLMEEHPDSALAVISDIDSTTLRGDKYLAKYALLKTQALVKNDSIITSPDLIRKAVEYYEKKGDSPDLMKSLFYNADVLRNMGNLTSAIKLSTHSYDLARRFDDPYWIAKTAEQLMFIYNASFNQNESKKYATIACLNYKKAGRYVNHLYSLCDLCVDDSNMGNYDIALARIDSIISILSDDAGEELRAYCHRERFSICLSSGRYDDARKSLEELRKRTDVFPLEPRYLIKEAELLRNTGHPKEAEMLVDSVSKMRLDVRDKAHLYELIINMSNDNADYYKASSYLDSMLMLQNEEVRYILANDVALAEKEYYSNVYRTEENKSHIYRFWIIRISILAVLLILLLLTVHKVIVKRKNEKIESQIKDALILGTQLKDNETQRTRLMHALSEREADILNYRREVLSLFKEQWNTLNMLCHEYFEKGDSDAVRSSIVKSVENEIKKLKSPKSKRCLEQSANNYMNGIFERLRCECVSLKEDDITLLVLGCSGLNARTVCFLSGLTLKNYYAKRARLIERIKKQDNALGEEISGYMFDNQ
ncbi:MAG: hypothetical protein K2K97_02295 [Muribaculaceae bacterium]|nr:hypothetical protein [Muribaculaceae bacterium]